jgi:hypothetical protein
MGASSEGAGCAVLTSTKKLVTGLKVIANLGAGNVVSIRNCRPKASARQGYEAIGSGTSHTMRYAHVLDDEVAEGFERVAKSRKKSRSALREVG